VGVDENAIRQGLQASGCPRFLRTLGWLENRIAMQPPAGDSQISPSSQRSGLIN
jgi:hypothetical protein